MFDRCVPGFTDWLVKLDTYADDLIAIGDGPPPQPRWRQDWFPRLDAAMAYTFVREMKPGRLVEVGSGHSTRFFARAVTDGGLKTQIHAIDPAPRADLCGLNYVTVHRDIVQNAPREIFMALSPGDILSIDSSHILMPGSDVDILFNDILPALPDGVLVHIHDIFLPDDYPNHWEWRGYNEQQGAGILLQSKAFQLLFSSRYAATRMAPQLAQTVIERLPLMPGAMETGLWLKKG